MAFNEKNTSFARTALELRFLFYSGVVLLQRFIGLSNGKEGGMVVC